MGRSLVPRYHVGLDFAQLTDEKRHELVAGIKQSATTSTLILGSSAMQATVASMLIKDAALTASSAVVTLDKTKLKNDLATDAGCRSALDGEVRGLAVLAENGAKSIADVNGTGLPAHVPTPKKKLPPDSPVTIDTSFPKTGHGKATVTVHEIPGVRHQYIAEWSPNPIAAGSWAALGIGLGKTRVVTGASGTQVWVRFATVRGQLQSTWSTPILVTIP